MKVFYEVKVLAVVPKSFTSNEGDDVSYNEVYMLNVNEEGEKDVLKLNTKLPAITDELDGKDGVAEIDIDVRGQNKPKLVGFKAH